MTKFDRTLVALAAAIALYQWGQPRGAAPTCLSPACAASPHPTGTPPSRTFRRDPVDDHDLQRELKAALDPTRSAAVIIGDEGDGSVVVE